jgi:hypothetical protein
VAYQQIAEDNRVKAVNRVILACDGDFSSVFNQKARSR